MDAFYAIFQDAGGGPSTEIPFCGLQGAPGSTSPCTEGTYYRAPFGFFNKGRVSFIRRGKYGKEIVFPKKGFNSSDIKPYTGASATYFYRP